MSIRTNPFIDQYGDWTPNGLVLIACVIVAVPVIAMIYAMTLDPFCQPGERVSMVGPTQFNHIIQHHRVLEYETLGDGYVIISWIETCNDH